MCDSNKNRNRSVSSFIIIIPVLIYRFRKLNSFKNTWYFKKDGNKLSVNWLNETFKKYRQYFNLDKYFYDYGDAQSIIKREIGAQ